MSGRNRRFMKAVRNLMKRRRKAAENAWFRYVFDRYNETGAVGLRFNAKHRRFWLNGVLQ